METTRNIKESLDRRIHALSVAWCINTFAYSIAYPFLPLYLHTTRGFPMSRVGLIYLIMGVARMLAPPVAGLLVDIVGRRDVLIASPIVRGVFFLILAGAVHFEAGFWTLGALLFLVMFIGGFFQNASDAYVSDITPVMLQPEAFSRIRVGLNLGWMTGPALGAFLARTPFSLLFAITGLLCWITPLIVMRYCSEPDRKPAQGKPELRPAALIPERPFLLLLLCALPLLVVSSQLISTLSIYAKEHINMSGNQIGFLYTMNGLLVIVLQVRVSQFVSRTHLAARIAAGALFYAAGYFSLAFCNQAWHAYLSVSIFTLGEMLVFPSLVSAASRMAPFGMVGRYMGIYGLVWGLGYSLGPFLGSVLYGRVGTQPIVFWGIVMLSALLACGCFMLMRRIKSLK